MNKQHQDYLISPCFSASSEAEQKTRTQPLVLCEDGYEKYSASFEKLFHNILTEKHSMMGRGIKKVFVFFHPPSNAPIPSKLSIMLYFIITIIRTWRYKIVTVTQKKNILTCHTFHTSYI